MTSCLQARQGMSDLLAGDVSPEASEALEVHLRSCPACEGPLEQMVLQDRDHFQLVGDSLVPELRARILRSLDCACGPAWQFKVLALSVAALLLVVPALYWGCREEVREPAAGDALETRAGGSLVVRYADGTRLRLGENTRLRAESGPAKAFLERGTVSAEVAKQPAGRPLVFRTPHCRVTVLGTSFTLAVGLGSTRVQVREGRVQVLRVDDGSVIDLTEGRSTVVTADVLARDSFAGARLGPGWRLDRGRWSVRNGAAVCDTSSGYATMDVETASVGVSATLTVGAEGWTGGLLAAATLENGQIRDGVQARLLPGSQIQVWEWADGATNLGRRDLAFAAAPEELQPGVGYVVGLTVSGRTATVSVNGTPKITVPLRREHRGTRVGMSLDPSTASGGTWQDFKVTR